MAARPQLDLIGELAFVLKRKGSPDRFECGVGLGFEKGDTVSALLFGLSGIQIGLAKERSTTLTFPGGECKSCVAIMGLTNARLGRIVMPFEAHYTPHGPSWF